MNPLFQEPHEKGFEEIYGSTEGSLTGRDIAFLVVILIAFSLWMAFALNSSVGASSEATGDVKEVGGVLFYPDGMPVRNYEQLEIYLRSE